jgi:sugar O-acyltransferase (sialic acid O-acetyltransferase NeuD family)
MKEKSIVIYGAGYQAETISYYFSYFEKEVAAFTVEKDFFDSTELWGLPVVPFEDICSHYPPDKYKIFIAVGPQYVNQARERIYHEAKSKGYSFANGVFPKNLLFPNAVFGENVFIGGSRIGPFVEIGNNVSILDTKIAHHTQIKDNVLISSSTLGGGVTVEKNVLIGMGSIIAPKTHIGAYSIIGMGSVITHDVEPYSVYTHNSAVKREVNSLKLKCIN